MIMLGILPAPEGHNEGHQRERTGWEWMKHAGKINLTDDDVARMGAAEQRLALDRLKPLKRVIELLESSLGERR